MQDAIKEISIAKFGDGHSVNEDAARAGKNILAVSDGAGGGGVYTDEWSRFLVEHLPEKPLGDFDELDEWVDGIWETFYKEHEEKAKQHGGLLLDKFYDEGSYATLIAVWKKDKDDWLWCCYGDSVAFHYNRKTGTLEHSFTELKDFDHPPYLINYNDALKPSGFRSGTFHTDADSVVFCASDSLSHYILMMYEVANKDKFSEELRRALDAHSKNSNLVRNAFTMPSVSFDDVLDKLLESATTEDSFIHRLSMLKEQGLLTHDDYSLAYFIPSIKNTDQ